MRVSPNQFVRLMALGLSAGLAVPSFAAPGEDRGVAEISPVEVEGIDGRVSVVDGIAGADGDKFNVPGLSIFQPASVTLVAGRKGDDLNLRLGQFSWAESFLGGSTGSKAYHIDRFRTQGDLLITVTSKKPDTPYRLIVWTGPEVEPELQPVLVPESEADGNWGKLIMIGIAALLLLGGAFYLGRRRRIAA